MSDTSQGDGWWQASDGKWYAPEAHPSYQTAPPPPPSAAPAPPSQQAVQAAAPVQVVMPAKRRRIWPWVLLGVLVVIVGGCGLLIAAIDDAVDEIDQQNEEALAETSCAVVGVDAIGDIDVELTVDNTTSQRSDYFIEFEIRDADGAFLGDGFGSATNVPAGESITESTFTSVDAPNGSAEGVTCAPIDVSRSASN